MELLKKRQITKIFIIAIKGNFIQIKKDEVNPEPKHYKNVYNSTLRKLVKIKKKQGKILVKPEPFQHKTLK